MPKHPKNTDVGNKEVWIGPEVLIDLADAQCLKEGENATFIHWGNLLIKKVSFNNFYMLQPMCSSRFFFVTD